MKTIRAAQNLQKLGFESKSVFGIISNNGPHLAPIVFASLCLGCIIHPIDPLFRRVELKHLIDTTESKMFFCDISVYDLLIKCLNELNVTAKIFTFNGKRGASTPVEDLFIATNNEENFL